MRKKGAWRTEPTDQPRGAPEPLSPERKRERTMERAARLLAARPRSVGELRARLLEKEWTDEATVEAVLERLREYGYLDDEKFAQNYAAYQIRQKAVGPRRLKHELAQRQVAPETVAQALEEAFNEVPEETLLDETLARRLRSKGRPATPAEVQNLAAFLLRRGFSSDLVWEKVRALRRADDEY